MDGPRDTYTVFAHKLIPGTQRDSVGTVVPLLHIGNYGVAIGMAVKLRIRNSGNSAGAR